MLQCAAGVFACVPVLLAASLAPVYGAPAAAPPSSEQLRYNVEWPSGLSLGEASLSFTKTPAVAGQPGRIDGELTLDASIPGFQVTDRYGSRATTGYCSVRFDKKLRHGARQADEAMDFDQQRMTASRQTLTASHEPGVDLGKADMSVPACAKDALTYLSFLRNELAQGRLPQEQPVFFGAAYDVRVDFRGTETVKVGDARMQADRVNISLHGPASELSFTVFFAQDAARTPVLFRVPLALGTFSMELAKP
ncbi:MAG: DUF3108 domain-containing protein [Bryobacteraceae bacterium]|jgi:hypothetical protein